MFVEVPIPVPGGQLFCEPLHYSRNSSTNSHSPNALFFLFARVKITHFFGHRSLVPTDEYLYHEKKKKEDKEEEEKEEERQKKGGPAADVAKSKRRSGGNTFF